MAKAHRGGEHAGKADKGAESVAVYDAEPGASGLGAVCAGEPGLEVVSSLPNELECTAPGANKGAALAGIARQRRLSRSR